jgi:glucose/mannose transport system substrate-binding protein
MGDWAYGELLVKQKKIDGKDFTYATFGDANTFVTVGDSFVIGKTAKNQAGGVAFAKAIMDPKVQLAFNKLKGSAPVRSDVSTKTLGKYQQGAAKVLANGKRVPSLVHGQANVAAAVGQAYADSVTLLQANKSVAKFTKAMDAAIAAN